MEIKNKKMKNNKKINKKMLASIVTLPLFLASCSIKGSTKNLNKGQYDDGLLGLQKDSLNLLNSNIPRGIFKLGAIGSDFSKKLMGSELKELIHSYSQDITDNSKTGNHFLKLPTNFWFKSSEGNWEIDKNTFDSKDKDNIHESLWCFSTRLEDHISKMTSANQFNNKGVYIAFPNGGFKSLLTNNFDGLKYNKNNFNNTNDIIFDIWKKFETNEIKLVHFVKYLKEAIIKFGLESKWKVTEQYVSSLTGLDITPTFIDNDASKPREIKIFYNNNTTGGVKKYESTAAKLDVAYEKDFADNPVNLKSTKLGPASAFNLSTNTIKNNVHADGLYLKNSKLASLFIQVEDQVHNTEDYYQSLVTKKEFKDTKVFMVGEKSKSKSGSSSKVFAGGNISTASFNKYASAYLAGFQAAVSQLKYADDDKKYEETNVGVFVGSINDVTSKKKAFAFRRGVEAAASHPSYSPYLKVSFVSKTADSRTTGKRLYFDVKDLMESHKISEFTTSDEFQSGDRKLIYLAGTTATDWRGSAQDNSAFAINENFGLIGSIYRYSNTGIASKGPQNINVVLDKLEGIKKNNTKHALFDAESSNTAVDRFERHGIQLLGTIGEESEATKVYSELVLQAMYNLTPIKYMLGKHTIFGAPLSLKYSSITASDQFSGFNGFNMKRYLNSIRRSYSKEVSESALISASPWMK